MNWLKKQAAVFAFFCIFAASGSAAAPFILGTVLEAGSGFLEEGRYGAGIARITPFAGLWLDGLGFARAGFSTGSKKESGEDGASSEQKRLDLSAQIGISAMGPDYPYISVSYVRAGSYSHDGDLKWNEIGAGFGCRFQLSQFLAVALEAEHRWITEHYDRQRISKLSGRRLQMNFGFIANPF